MKFAAIAVLASVNAFDVEQTVDELMETFDMRLTELIEENNFEAQDMVDEALEKSDVLANVEEGIDMWHRHHRDATPVDEALDQIDILTSIEEGLDMWHRHHRDATPVDEALDQIDILTSIEEGLDMWHRHHRDASPVDEALDQVDILSTVDEGLDMWHRHHRDADPTELFAAIDEMSTELFCTAAGCGPQIHRRDADTDFLDEALDHVDMLTAIQETMQHVDILSTVDEGIDMWHRHHRDATPVDEALDQIDILTAIDESFNHIEILGNVDEASDFMGLPTGDENIDELLAALPSILEEVEAITAPKSNTMMYAIIGSVSALIAIGAGFVIKSKYNAVDKDDHFESLL